MPISWSVAGAAFLLLMTLGHRRVARRPPEERERWLLTWVVAGQLLAIALLVAGRYRGVPLAALLLVAVALAVHTLTQKTTLGRYLYAIGGNEQAARFRRHRGGARHRLRVRLHGRHRGL